jgi:Cu/Ag efflux protein CusF
MVMKMSMIRLHGAVLVAVLLVSAVQALAQKPVAAAQEISESFTVEAIDHASRVVTLKDKAGLLEDVYCGPDVQRFDALKVGDTVTFRYYESVVTALRAAGGAPPAAQGATVTRTPGTAPGGTIAQQLTATVTIEAIDAKVPSVTVRSAAGRRSSFRVADAKNLEGYKAGDQVDVTYTRGVAISVK